MKRENNYIPVKERFGEEEKENTGLQQPSVSSQVKFGAAWANQKVFLTQMAPLCLDNHSVPMLEVQVLSAVGDSEELSAVGSAQCPGRTGCEGAEPPSCQARLGEQPWFSTWMFKSLCRAGGGGAKVVQSWSLLSTQTAQFVPGTGWKRRQWEFGKGTENRHHLQAGAGVWDRP